MKYVSIRVYLETWQVLTRISAETVEPITRIIARLATQEEARIKAEKQQKGNENATD